MNLYEMNKEYQNALESAFIIDQETGEVIMQAEALEKLDGEFKDKVDNIACYIKNLEALAEAIKQEKKSLDERIKSNETKAENLRNYISDALKQRGMDKLETARNKVSFRFSKSVNVIDESKINETYYKTEIVKKIDKKTILDELKNGVVVDGCELLEKSNLQIK